MNDGGMIKSVILCIEFKKKKKTKAKSSILNIAKTQIK